ncbi:hypothetical protein NP233_g10411 [Leucocoprinus birnbaumii]|uniref:Uncharacterized protein n=1 Tax=Leucocoprinus birnbaumii TaxID=56174 RepID=A0AAD5VJA0_9AGAR|nr:hypothetical protein NP233_g10411 [Leucocoprinus birnbaumii]
MSSTKLSQTLLPLILLSSFLQLAPQVNAANDWSQPCFSGVCYYDLPESQTGPSGTLKIWGDNYAIADITTAGGWEILECDPNSLAQDIRIVCKNADSSGGCSNLFATPSTTTTQRTASSSTSASVGTNADVLVEASGPASIQGALGKMVRLPENCGKSAFARISNIYIPTNQSIPASVSRRLVTRDETGTKPQVKAISVDTDFDKESVPKYGPVNFAVVAANRPGATVKGDLDTSDLVRQARRSLSSVYAPRGFNPFDNSFDFDKSFNFHPFTVDQSFSLPINEKLDCSSNLPVGGVDGTVGVNGEIEMNVNTNIRSTVSLGVIASGKIVPPSFDNFDLTSDFSAILDSSFTVNAGVGGDIDTGKIQVFGPVEVPGLGFHGIFSIGPTFEVNAQGKVSLDLDLDMTVGVKWTVDSAQFTFPDGGSTKDNSFKPADTPFQITVQPSGASTGRVELHLIPRINLGISAAGGTVSAGVFIDLDASATAVISGTATDTQQSQCFGEASQPGRRSDMIPKRTLQTPTSPIAKRDLKCNSGNGGTPTQLATTLVPATQFA